MVDNSSNRENLEDFRNMEEIDEEWTSAGLRASGATTHRGIQDVDQCQTLLNQRQHLLGLTEDRKCPRAWRRSGDAQAPV